MLPCAILGYAHDKRDVQAVCDAATLLGEHQLRRGYAPMLWDSPAVYRREEQRTLPGVERIQLPEETHAMGYGDCDDLAPWGAASMRLSGIPARAYVVESPGIGYHVAVLYRGRDGERRVWDPSAERGMLEVGAHGSRLANMKRKASAALRRAEQIAVQLESMNPSSSAYRALAQEGLRLVRSVPTEETEGDADGSEA
jgi:hypothetical protein